jgi:transposase-like protein
MAVKRQWPDASPHSVYIHCSSRRRFEDYVIVLCVRWYLRFKLSYRDMAQIAWELGVSVSPCTILRWVVRYAEELATRWLAFEQRVGRSCRADETYVKVGGQWMFLYRAVDERGRTVESYLSRTRDVTAAKAFFAKRSSTMVSPDRSPWAPSSRVMRHCGGWVCRTSSTSAGKIQ